MSRKSTRLTQVFFSLFLILFTSSIVFPQTTTQFRPLPSLKLLLGQGLSPAFDIANYCDDTETQGFIIGENFLGLASLDGSTVSQNAYDTATAGTNVFYSGIYDGTTFIARDTASNKVKYSTYRIRRLPKIGMTAGKSYDFNIAPFVSSVTESQVPASFGNEVSLFCSNDSTLSVQWLDVTTLRITAFPEFTAVSYIDVIASPSAEPPFADYDRERIYVYPNLIPSGTFDNTSDMTRFAFDYAGERSNLAEYSFQSTAVDSALKEAQGVIQVTLSSISSGVKITPNIEDLIPYEENQWYIARMRVTCDVPENDAQILLYNYSNPAFPGFHVDIAANAWFGIPSTWHWLETPLYSKRTGMGYPQIQVKSELLYPVNKPKIKAATSVYIDELQLIKAVPILMEPRRGDNRVHYYAGDFDDPDDIHGWGVESYAYNGEPVATPEFTIGDGVLHLSFDTTTASIIGGKLTAQDAEKDSVYTFNSRSTYGLGMQAKLVNLDGDFESFESILLCVAMGVPSMGSYEIGTRNSDLFATAEFGGLTPGVQRAFGLEDISSFYQFQFAIKTDRPGTIDIDDLDGIEEGDYEESFGDTDLF
jgi:hypothetical protein